MNKNEKKALISFLSIYVGSIVLLVGLLLSLYYKNELNSVSQQCTMLMKNASNEIKAHILNSYMKKEKLKPLDFKNKDIKYALFDKNKKLIFSNMGNKDEVILNQKNYETSEYTYYVTEIEDDNILVKYIAIQTCSGVQNKDKLKVIMITILILTSIFVAIIACLLAKLLLKPVREKVESMDNFIKDTAHELNTPISVLMTSVSMLKKGKNPEKMMKYIVSSSKQISQLYNDIHFSTFSNLDESVEESFCLKQLVSNSVEYFNDISITKNISIKSELEPTKVKADKNKIQKIVNNLISNAIKYSHNDSEIIVRLKDAVFSVEDFGIGIDKKQQEDIFKRYKRGENSEGGFGIGLDIVKRVAKDYDLNIELKSKINQGSTFYIYLQNILVDVDKREF
ncbi:HAMP domain-containing sensor histidine kinase [Arcobacter sp. CECT 8985]|uniref:sensor histidine kinase n=1 Tax=Arcobacter sp. CECT 8985 TaxID=1935424 RepID=UPI00100ABAE0|nr:HAMP domain-containing sensor histidine kinase [Arcobacter sp. CECT 8985]RXJ87313.1 two-component sensor histidine kinase [Arcobacter sp. CECT 8985]